MTNDVGETGDSIGDKCLGERELRDADGNIVGMLRWVEHVVDIDESKGGDAITHTQIIYSLPEGTLHANGQLVFKNAMDKDTQPTNLGSIAVVGGTGAYVKTHGEIVATFEPGKPSRYEFQFYCD